nr:cyclin pch1 [Quercus suber]
MPPTSHPVQMPAAQSAVRQRPKSPNRILAEAEAQWLFTEAELANTPSIQDGMPATEERDTRSKGINFIIQVGVMLKLPQLTISTAAVFFQRFLMRASMKKARNGIPKLHHYQIAATCLFLATKVEESCRKMKEMILAFCRVAQKNPNLVVDEQSKDWWRWRDCILHNEDVLLETLCFDLTVESPHRHLLDLLKAYGVEHNKSLRNSGWAFVTDANNTYLCLMYSSRTLALAAFYAACRSCEVALPDDPKGRPWWEAQGVRLKDIRQAVEHMCALYESTTNEVNGTVPGATTSDGGGASIYASLTTPMDAGRDGWDTTRERKDVNTPSLQPLASDRRLSNGSSVGTKRDRNNDQTDRHGVSESESKRARLADNGVVSAAATGENGVPPPVVATPIAALPNEEDLGAHDLKHKEEQMRVAYANGQAKADAKIMETTHAAAADEGSEEGEVEE